MGDIPERALSIMQPWAWLIVSGHKTIENRDWPTNFRGPIAIHAGKKRDLEAWEDVTAGRHPVTGEIAREYDHDASIDLVGGIVGVAEIIDCISASDDPYFVGAFGFVIANARPVPFIPVKGALGFFRWRNNLVTP